MGRGTRDTQFTDFVSANGGRLLRSATLLCGDERRAEDLVQTALEKTYLRWHQIAQEDPYGYVYRAIVNGHRDWWRRSRGREWTMAAPPERVQADVSSALTERLALMQALRTLTKRERAVLVLRYFEDRSEAEIAQLLVIAPGTVKSTAARGLAKLRTEHGLAADLHRTALIQEDR